MIKKRHKGTSIIEVLITIAIIGIGFLAAFSILDLSLKIALRSQHINLAFQHIDQTMENLRALPFNSLNIEVQTENLSILPQATLTRTITSFQGDTTLKQINLEIKWLEKGRWESVKESTLATPRGINR
jgi:prepilin-type N-terminal cleavage/methylation domain-containing protein